jgi:hypothetical protein
LFSRRENMAVCGICGKILNREGKFEDVASLLWLCTLARWGKKILWHPMPQEFYGSHMDCLARGEKIVSFLAHVTSKILGDVFLFLR